MKARILRSPAPVKERPILFSGPMVRAILEGRKTQTRRLVDLKRAVGTPEVPEGHVLQLWHPGATLRNGYKPDWDRCSWQVERVCGPACTPSPKGVYPPTGHVDWEGPFDGWPGPYDGRHPVAWGPLPFWPGLRLWVKETFQSLHHNGVRWVYRADGEDPRTGWDDVPAEKRPKMTWRPSIYMPRIRSRITLEVTGVRVERLQEITEDDAKAEGARDFFESFPCFAHDQTLTSGERAADSPVRAGFAVLWDEINADRGTWKSNPWVWVVSFQRKEN